MARRLPDRSRFRGSLRSTGRCSHRLSLAPPLTMLTLPAARSARFIAATEAHSTSIRYRSFVCRSSRPHRAIAGAAPPDVPPRLRDHAKHRSGCPVTPPDDSARFGAINERLPHGATRSRAIRNPRHLAHLKPRSANTPRAKEAPRRFGSGRALLGGCGFVG